MYKWVVIFTSGWIEYEGNQFYGAYEVYAQTENDAIKEAEKENKDYGSIEAVFGPYITPDDQELSERLNFVMND